MQKSDIDFRAFAQLRGKEDKKPVNWAMLAGLILFLAGLVLLLSHKGWAALLF
jgi:hypothetical protein